MARVHQDSPKEVSDGTIAELVKCWGVLRSNEGVSADSSLLEVNSKILVVLDKQLFSLKALDMPVL